MKSQSYSILVLLILTVSHCAVKYKFKKNTFISFDPKGTFKYYRTLQLAQDHCSKNKKCTGVTRKYFTGVAKDLKYSPNSNSILKLTDFSDDKVVMWKPIGTMYIDSFEEGQKISNLYRAKRQCIALKNKCVGLGVAYGLFFGNLVKVENENAGLASWMKKGNK